MQVGIVQSRDQQDAQRNVIAVKKLAKTRGETYLECRQIEAALRQLQWALELHPKEPWLYRTMGLALWKQRKIIAALGDWSRAAYLYSRRALRGTI